MCKLYLFIYLFISNDDSSLQVSRDQEAAVVLCADKLLEPMDWRECVDTFKIVHV